MSSDFGVTIVGGGVAGMAGALWCSELGLACVVVEKSSRFGGQLHWIHGPIQNYLGVQVSSGPELLEKIEESLNNRRFETRFDAKIIEIDLDGLTLKLSSGETLRSSSIVLATGIRRRTLGISGEEFYKGKGVLETGQTGHENLRNKKVVVVGGGDAACENAVIFSQFADKVTVIHRGNELSARAQFRDQVLSSPKIEVILSAVVHRLIGSTHLETIEFVNVQTGTFNSIDVDFLLIRIGVEPNSDLFRGGLDLDERGYIKVDQLGRTSLRNVYAIGDVANPSSPTLSTAVGSASTAVKAISNVRLFELQSQNLK